MDEEQTNSPAPASLQVLPKYPELILAAIAAVDEKNGANKSSISKQIEATYGSLPAAHSTLLSHHLNKMKASGELIVVKNNYVKPDPNASPKRGRGRPAKPKEPLPEGTDVVVSPPRSRGRPPKPKVPLPEGTVVSPPRPRGRPPKPKVPLPEGTVVVVSPPKPRGRPPKPKVPLPEGAVVTPPRPRGRPRKPHDPLAPSPVKATQSVSGRKRGRPRKSGGTSTPVSSPPNGERRGRGRPPKLQTPAADPVEA
ncbi:hypothetical protein L2E82_43006 [Cichorium intybus]|uniref:Uncharacterized protein n=1 Tax=Cichorium intybus TaxID=13427 RepID=A0ACB8ZSD0_CICIN|nr:hypothetical protein L2E82_43006 [Cichorium intybus]